MTLDMTQTDDIPALMADIGARAKAAASCMEAARNPKQMTACGKAKGRSVAKDVIPLL